MIQKLQREDYEQVYQILEASFPITERRPYEKQVELLEEPLYQIYVLKDEKENLVQGFMAVWEFETYTFLEHFAVNPAYRNSGFGSVMIKELLELSVNPVFLEVELPDTEMAVRRIGFYERNGLFYNAYPYMQPALTEGCEPIPLRIMTSGNAVEEEQFHEIAELVYREVYQQKYTPFDFH